MDRPSLSVKFRSGQFKIYGYTPRPQGLNSAAAILKNTQKTLGTRFTVQDKLSTHTGVRYLHTECVFLYTMWSIGDLLDVI